MSRIFERNGVLKIISVIIAVILWLYATSELNPEVPKVLADVPIDIINQDVLEKNQMTLVFDPAKNLELKMRGLTSEVRRIEPDKVKAVLDLSEIEKVGMQKVRLDVEGLPREIRFEEIPEITVTVDNIVSKDIPVVVTLSGEKASGYFYHSPVTDTKNIRIDGAETLVTKVAQGIIEMNIKGARESIEQSLPIILVDSDKRRIESRYIRKQKDYAIGSLSIYPEKTLTVKPNILGTPAVGYEVTSISVEPEKITVNGEAGILSNKNELETDPVNIEDRTGDLITTVDISHEGFNINPNFDDRVKVIINISEKYHEKTVTVSNIDIHNEPENVTVEYEPQSVRVTLSGGYNSVVRLNGQSIGLSVSLKDLQPGTHEVPITIDQLPDGISAKLEPSKLKVIITENKPSGEDNEQPTGEEPTASDQNQQDQ